MKSGYTVEERKKLFTNLIISIWNRVSEKNDIQKCLNDIQAYDNDTYIHSVSVGILAAGIGLEMRIPNIESLFISALLHDYGKLFIPLYILNKPDNCNEVEIEIIRKHTILGFYELCKRTNCSTDILKGVLEHHERADGSGYGFNKKDESISTFAKIIAIADVYNAMVTKRVYRIFEHTHNEAVEYIRDNAGVLFNKDITKAFLENIELYKDIIDNQTQILIPA